MKKFWITLISVFFSAPAFAVTDIYNPQVEKGVAEIEIGAERQEDDNDILKNEYDNLEADFRYGFTDNISFGIQANADRTGDSSDFEYKITGFENTIEFAEQGEKSPVSVGLRTEYEHNHISGRADSVNSALLFDYRATSFDFLLNVGLHTDVGAGTQTDLSGDLKSMAKILISPMFEPGVLYVSDTGEFDHLNDFQDQNNRVGPYLYGEITPNFYYEAAYLYGLTDAARDKSYVVNFGYKMNLGNPLMTRY